jgi:hypothetical protein
MLSHGIFFFSNKRRKKNTRKKKTIKKKKNAKKGSNLPSSSHSALFTFGSRFCPLAFALLFQVFSPNIFFFSNIRKKNTKTKKNIEKKKMQKREKTYL